MGAQNETENESSGFFSIKIERPEGHKIEDIGHKIYFIVPPALKAFIKVRDSKFAVGVFPIVYAFEAAETRDEMLGWLRHQYPDLNCVARDVVSNEVRRWTLGCKGLREKLNEDEFGTIWTFPVRQIFSSKFVRAKSGKKYQWFKLLASYSKIGLFLYEPQKFVGIQPVTFFLGGTDALRATAGWFNGTPTTNQVSK